MHDCYSSKTHTEKVAQLSALGILALQTHMSSDMNKHCLLCVGEHAV